VNIVAGKHALAIHNSVSFGFWIKKKELEVAIHEMPKNSDNNWRSLI